MKPTKNKIEFEKVSVDDFVVGTIEDITYEKGHEFKYKGELKKNDAVKFKIIVEGCKYPKSSGWMTFSYGEKSKLYTKYLTSLVKNAHPDMDFDLDQLKGLKVKMLWKNIGETGDFQGIETIRPFNQKVVPLNTEPSKLELAEVEENDAIED